MDLNIESPNYSVSFPNSTPRNPLRNVAKRPRQVVEMGTIMVVVLQIAYTKNYSIQFG